MTLRYFPSSLARERSIMFELMGATVGGGQTMSGVMPIASLAGGGAWKATMSDVSLITADQVRAWRALKGICKGGTQPIIVPFCDRRQMPAPLVNGQYLYSLDEVYHSDDSPFDDDSGYASDVVSATLSADAALRDTSIVIDIATVGVELKGGEYFSIDHEELRWRLYLLETVIDNGDGTWDCTFDPPLRAAVSANTPLQFDRPKCVMRLATPNAMDLTLDLRKFGSPSVSFIEAFPPFPE